MKNILFILLCILFIACAPTEDFTIVDTGKLPDINIGDNIEEWRAILKNTDAAQGLADCEQAIEDQAATCSVHDGWMVDNAMEISVLSTDQRYDYQEIAKQGGCPQEDSPRTKIDTKLFDTATDKYQVICSVNCYSWECPVAKPSLSVENLACPRVASFKPGDLYSPGFSNARAVVPPSLLGPWGREGEVHCKYYRDSGQKEFGGGIIYEGGSLSVALQVDGSFSDRPEWAKEEYCTGKTNNRGAHVDIYSKTHVAKVTYSTASDYGADISGVMKLAAKRLLNDLENGYALACS